MSLPDKWSVHCSTAKQHAPEAAAAVDGQPAGGAPDDSHDADIAAVAGTDAVPSGEGVPGSSAPAGAPAQPAAEETPSLAALQPGSSGKLLLTVRDGSSLPGTAAGDVADAGPAAGAALAMPGDPGLPYMPEPCS